MEFLLTLKREVAPVVPPATQRQARQVYKVVREQRPCLSVIAAETVHHPIKSPIGATPCAAVAVKNSQGCGKLRTYVLDNAQKSAEKLACVMQSERVKF